MTAKAETANDRKRASLNLPVYLRNYSLAVLVATATFATHSEATEPNPEMSLALREALNILASRLRADNAYEPWAKDLRCLSFMSEKEAKTYVDIAIHEKHGGECEGDPSTYPVVDRFRVSLRSKEVLWLNHANGQLMPYKAFLKSRHPVR